MKRVFLSGAVSALLLGCAGAPPDVETDPPEVEDAADAVVMPDPTAPFETSAVATDDEVAALVASTNAAAVAVYKAASAEPGNAIVSPISVAAAFALLQEGAVGNTADELSRTLGFDGVDAERLPDAMGSLLKRLETDVEGDPDTVYFDASDPDTYGAPPNPAATFSIANAAWVHTDYSLKADYARKVRDLLGARVKSVDFFARGGEDAAERINAWASAATRERIPTIVEGKEVYKLALGLTNAVWFKAYWAVPFDPKATKAGDFTSVDRGAIPAMLMRNSDILLPYVESDGTMAVAMSYTNPDFRLVLVLPPENIGIRGFESEMTAESLAALLDGVDNAPRVPVDLLLPKAEIASGFDLIPPLKALGVRDVFEPYEADLSGLLNERSDLYVSVAKQKTFFNLDEASTEAAAVTFVGVRPVSLPPPPKIFHADRPFMVVLEHVPTEAILFMGRIEEVTE